MADGLWRRRAVKETLSAEEQKEIISDAIIPDSVAKGSTGHWSAAVRGDSLKLLFLLLVLAVMIPVLLRFSGGEPVLAGWSLSLLLVFCLFVFTCCFSTAATPLTIIFVSLSYGVLLAYLAGNLLSDVLGMVIMYLDSVLAAGFFGSTLAQHRQGNGAALFVANSPAQEKQNKDALYFFLGVLTLGSAARLLWMMLPIANYSPIDVAETLLAALAIFLWLHISCVIHWLNGALSSDESSSIVFFCLTTVTLLFFCFLILVSELAAVTVLWLCLLASTAFLGYCLHIHASYEQIMIRRNHSTASLVNDLGVNNDPIISGDQLASLDDNKAFGMPVEPTRRTRSPVSLLNDLLGDSARAARPISPGTPPSAPIAVAKIPPNPSPNPSLASLPAVVSLALSKPDAQMGDGLSRCRAVKEILSAEEQKEIISDAIIPDSEAKGSTGRWSAAVRGDSLKLLFLLLVLAVMIPVLLRFSRGEPVLAGWSLSLLLVFCLFVFTCCFSTAATPLTIIFISLSYGVLLAYLAGNLLSDVLGMVIMYLASVLAAGFFGSTLAQHRQGNGAALFVANSPAQEKQDKDALYFFLAVLTLGSAARLLWMMLPVANYSPIDVAETLLAALAIFLWLHISCVIHWLNGALSSDESSSIVFLCLTTVTVLFFCFLILVSELVAVTVLWLCLLASTAFLGYCLHIHASYEQIVIRRNHSTVSLVNGLGVNNGAVISGDPLANLDDNKALGMPVEPTRSPLSLLKDLGVNNNSILSENQLANLDYEALGMQLEPTRRNHSPASLVNHLGVNNDTVISEGLLANLDDNKALGMPVEPTRRNHIPVSEDPLANPEDNKALGMPVESTRSPASLPNDLDVNNNPILSEDPLELVMPELTRSPASLPNDVDVNNNPILSEEDLLEFVMPELIRSPASLPNDLDVNNEPISSEEDPLELVMPDLIRRNHSTASLVNDLVGVNKLGVPAQLNRRKHHHLVSRRLGEILPSPSDATERVSPLYEIDIEGVVFPSAI